MPAFEMETPQGRFEVEAPDQAKAVAVLKNYEPTFFERLGNATYDKLKGLGLPVDRMRRENKAVDDAVRGMADTLSFGVADEIAAGANALLGGYYTAELERQRKIDEEGGRARLTGQLIGGLAGGAALARSGLSPTAKLLRRGRGLGTVTAASIGETALLAGLHGFGTGEGLEDRASSTARAAVTGAVAGGATPALVTGATSFARRLVSPNQISLQRQTTINSLKGQGIETTAGQQTGSKRLQSLESEIGGKRAEQIYDRQREQFTAAALRRAGIDAERATPETMSEGLEAISQRLDVLAARNRMIPDKKLADALIRVDRDYKNAVRRSHRATVVRGTLNDLIQKSRSGQLHSGQWYRKTRARLDRMARRTSNKKLAEALGQMLSALDDAMERSIAKNNPSDFGAWKEVRRQYKNFLVLEEAVNAATGLIDPTRLRDVAATQNRSTLATGQSDFGGLARAGLSILRPMPEAGTSSRIRAQLLGTSVPANLGRVMMTRPVQAYLTNQTMSPVSPKARALIHAMGQGVTAKLAAL